MKLSQNLFPPIVKAILVAAAGIACCSFPVVSSAETDTIPLQELPPNSRLAIWGDSITELTYYPRYVEMYLLACAGAKTSGYVPLAIAARPWAAR